VVQLVRVQDERQPVAAGRAILRKYAELRQRNEDCVFLLQQRPLPAPCL